MTKRDLIKTIAVFSIIALFSGIILGLFVQLAHISDEERQLRAQKVLESFYDSKNFEPIDFQNLDLNEDLVKNIQYFFYDETDDVYAVVAKGVKGYGDVVIMYVIIKDDKIAALKAGDNKETPGVSDKAFGQNFYKRFLNKDVKNIGFTDIETGASEGAAYSKKAVISSIKNAVDFYIEYKKVFG